MKLSSNHSAENHHHDKHEHVQDKNSPMDWFTRAFFPHEHSHQNAALDPNLATERGLRAVKLSFAGLILTGLFQAVIVMVSGSVALLADTIHNFSDALTAIPLGLAFLLSRRPRNPRYTYGYGRAEDLAGVVIVLMIAFSAGEAIYQAILKLINPLPVTNVAWVAAAGLIGFIGNEFVAVYRLRTGKEIGSTALMADGQHARTDGFTSLAVLAGAAGEWLGFPLLDPLIGLGIGVAILGIVVKTGRDMWYRMMDAIDPDIQAKFIHIASQTSGVLDVRGTSMRWVGHRLWAETNVVVDPYSSTLESHAIAEEVRHRLFHALPALMDVIVHIDPNEPKPSRHYHPADHHTPAE